MGSARDNIVLVGMPGAGKSTVGVLLAKALALDFVDTDLLIQHREGRSLQAIFDAEGYEGFLAIEEAVLCALSATRTVISTGGSAIYSDKAMAHLKRDGRVVFLDVPLAVLKIRLHNMNSRGVAQKPGQDLGALFQERWPLYHDAADIEIDCADHSQETVLALIVDAI